MNPPFDIFKVESIGLRWMELAVDLERAKARVQVLAASSLRANISETGLVLLINEQ
jgi:hypothetical protein